jgi:RNA recognition motif-containing protein
MNAKLYVGNLSYSTTEDDLRILFAQAGSVTSAKIVKDRDTDRSRGFAFVEMSTQAEAEKAISMFNAFNLNDRQLTVNAARPREERQGFGGPRTGMGMGGGRRAGGGGGGGSRRGGGGGTRRY